MKSISVQHLREGFTFSDSLYVDGNVFLPAKIAITKNDLHVLQKLGVAEVFTNGMLLPTQTGEEAPQPAGQNTGDAGQQFSQLQDSLRQQDESSNEAAKGQIFDRLSAEIRIINNQFNIIAVGKTAKPRIFWTVVATLLQLVKYNKLACIEFILGNNIKDCELARNAVNSAILSAVISMEMGANDKVVPEIVSAALLHDTGMLRLPRDLLEKTTPLTDEEKLIIQSHTVGSFRIVQDELRYPAMVSTAVLQHHERWDGLGYPQRISGIHIDKSACIIAVADAFEAMVSKKPYRNSMTAYAAMKTMLSENFSHFSSKVLQTFIKVMGIYPIGSGVILNNGSHAKVQDNNKDAPLRPILKVVGDAKGQPIHNGEVIDLLSNKSVYITTTFDLK
ncbi:MAG: HD-GYP domain-containing protein [Spirochaetaceae bacterium]|jgi:HD-GYP domain-containing protein (c-di-GMP phosphodiesterase class II)|nr:HD-GYP domain-containing protein [Spirochaetaceae bacterium]